jgi:hypothetical protein
MVIFKKEIAEKMVAFALSAIFLTASGCLADDKKNTVKTPSLDSNKQSYSRDEEAPPTSFIKEIQMAAERARNTAIDPNAEKTPFSPPFLPDSKVKPFKEQDIDQQESTAIPLELQ